MDLAQASVISSEMDLTQMAALEEACWPMMLIWERINQAFTSDSPPKTFGFQKGDYGYQIWFFNSCNERYSVVWDTFCSYWKVVTPFGPVLYFIGPLFIDKTSTGLRVQPSLTVISSEANVLTPSRGSIVAKQIMKIARFVMNSVQDSDLP